MQANKMEVKNEVEIDVSLVAKRKSAKVVKVEKGVKVEKKIETAATTTFSFSVENHAGMQMLGAMSEKGHSLEDLLVMRENVLAMAARQGLSCVEVEIFHLNPALDVGAAAAAAEEKVPAASNAYVLVVRHGASLMLGATDENRAEVLAAYEAELRALNVDKQALMRGRVVNKHARWNVCFDTFSQEADIAAGKGTVVPFDAVPHTKRIRENLEKMHPSMANIKAEYNDYYDVSVCGIGYHGDSERREVVAVRVGATMPIYYQWHHRSKPVGPRQAITLGGDDLYVMSEKSVGTDWKKSSMMTLRHSAGCDKFTVLKPAQPTVVPVKL
jgi:hypothetical protein